MSNWTDTIVGDRMAVDQTFTERVQASQFTSQEWGLIMTATDLEIENADDPDAARIVANTEAVESIIPELESIRSGMGPMAGPDRNTGSGGGGGVVESIKGALGLSNSGNGSDGGDSVDQEKLAAAESLAQEYADELQQHLESNDSFEAAREAYVESAES